MSHKSWIVAVLVAAFGLLPSQQVSAQNADTPKIDRLLEVMRAKDMVGDVIVHLEQMQQQIKAQVTQGREIDETRQFRLDAIAAESDAQMRKLLSWENLQPLYRQIYAQTFEDGDIDAMIEFYSSPAGQRVIERTPLLMQNTMAAMQQLVLPAIQQMEQDFREAGLDD